MVGFSVFLGSCRMDCFPPDTAAFNALAVAGNLRSTIVDWATSIIENQDRRL